MAKKPYSKFRSRLWKIVEIDRQLQQQLRHGRPCTTTTLLEALGDGIDERTLRRLIELMRDDLGAPIKYDRSQQTYLYTQPNWVVPNVHLDAAEMQAMATAIQAIRPVLPVPMSQRLDNLLAKLLDAMPESQRDEIRRAQRQIEFVPAAVLSRGAEWFEPLSLAIRTQMSVDMTYYVLSKQQETQRRFDPYYLRNYQGTWYVVGYDHLTKYWPILNLARIRKLSVSDDAYRVQPFSAARYFKGSLGVIVGGEPRLVRIRLTGYAASTAGERIWPPGFTYQQTGPNDGILSGKLADLTDLLHWVSSFQCEAEMLSDSDGPAAT
ncbi:MAG: WYL domain-containing protein [Phycisphaerales bacterium]|nr:WYL domain-containing protein [Phycisphaerales bacterium]